MLRQRIWLIAALTLLLLPYAAMGVWLAKFDGSHSLAAFAAVTVLQMLLTASVARSWRSFLLVQLPIWILCVAMTAYAIGYQMLPGRTIAYVILATSWDEIRGFLAIGPGQKLLLLTIISIGGYLLLACNAPRTPISPSRRAPGRWLAIGACLLLGGYAAADSERLIDGFAGNPIVGAGFFICGPMVDAKSILHGDRVTKAPYGATRVASNEVHIFVVGESARRDSWSVYGYSRPTTPYMDSIKSETFLFSHAVADANMTVYAVPMLLTGMHPDTFDLESVRGNIFDLAKQAGYSTAWFVNQDIGVSKMVGVNVDWQVAPSALSEFASGRMPMDETLLGPLRTELAKTSGPKFIGLHTTGSHWEYQTRYPEAFERFSPTKGLGMLSPFYQIADQRVVNAYDNSVVYTDWLLGQIIEAARKLNIPATVTYVSDHGEDLYMLDGRAGHGTSAYSPHQFNIPAFVWMNAAYRTAHPDKVQALTQNMTKEIHSHNFFYSLGDLIGTQWPGARPAESFVSPQFSPDSKTPLIIGGVLVANAY